MGRFKRHAEDMEVSPAFKRRLCSSAFDDVPGMPQLCDVCLDDAVAGDDGAIQLGTCGHRMCGSCAAAWAGASAARCLKQGAPLRCALPACGRAVPLQQAQRLLEAAGLMFEEEGGAAYEAVGLIPEEARFTCPYPDCGVLSELEAALPDAPSACPSCGRGVCPCCRCMWHSGLRCSEYQALGAGQRGSDKRCRVVWRRADCKGPQQAPLHGHAHLQLAWVHSFQQQHQQHQHKHKQPSDMAPASPMSP